MHLDHDPGFEKSGNFCLPSICILHLPTKNLYAWIFSTFYHYPISNHKQKFVVATLNPIEIKLKITPNVFESGRDLSPYYFKLIITYLFCSHTYLTVCMW